jgi:hypothetical protein
MLTADTITDEQIQKVFIARPDARFLYAHNVDLHETVEPYATLRRESRARCAELINAGQVPDAETCGGCGQPVPRSWDHLDIGEHGSRYRCEILNGAKAT